MQKLLSVKISLVNILIPPSTRIIDVLIMLSTRMLYGMKRTTLLFRAVHIMPIGGEVKKIQQFD